MLARNYYDLVTGLPDIAVDAARIPVTSGDFIDEIAQLVHPDDAALLRLVRLPVDNRNLVTLLEKISRPFEPGGNYGRDELAREIANSDTLPGYMAACIDARRADQELFPGLNMDDQLSWLFFDAVTAHKNEFVAAWFTFELNLRNMLAAASIRQGFPHLKQREPDYHRCLESALICRNDIAGNLLTSNAPDFGLAEQLPWVEQVMQLPTEDFVAQERLIDRLRWDMLNEMTTFTYFQIETIFAFCVRLMIVERWLQLDPQTGLERLEQLVAQLSRCEQQAVQGT